jgi:glycosyltransferase involved in cell wall biosynthesis
MKIDIHVHSKFSKRPSQWILKKIGCPESFSEPLQIHQIAKLRGMSHVTISDHNTIDGALEIAHLPNTFISEEITTYFPDSGCKVHVLALNITEAQHQEIQKIRDNIFALAPYLKKEKILSVVAHPLYAINDKLTISYFEQLLLLFQNFELNGARNPRENKCLKQVIGRLTEDKITQLANVHDMEPLYPNAWQKRLWGGSDDHSSLNITQSYSQISGIYSPKKFASNMEGVNVEVVSRPSTPLTMAHNLYGIAYQYYCSKFNLGRHADKDLLLRFLDRNLRTDLNSHSGLLSKLYLLRHYRREKKIKAPVSDSLVTLLRHETYHILQNEPQFKEKKKGKIDAVQQEQQWFNFVDQASRQVMLHFGNHLMDHVSGANWLNIFSTIGSAGGLYTLLAPYFVAYSQFAKDAAFSANVYRRFNTKPSETKSQTLRFAHFTDTFYEVNGVAKSLQQHVFYAQKHDKTYTIITCHDSRASDEPGVHNFKPIGTYDLPEYPEQKIYYPPFLEMLAYCYDNGINHIHSATPGPVGLAALAIAKILKLPFSGTYHTSIPQYAGILTQDETIEEFTWKYVLWYYDQMDMIYAPSQSTREELISKGLNSDKIKLYPRGIDVDFFHPSKRNGIFKKRYPLADGIKLLYVGRVSKEKNLHLLVNAFKRLVNASENIQLVIVGDGPYLDEMKAEVAGLPCYFTGYLKGEPLAAVYASADVFVFPSTTDTFGNVVLEAQASGLPVIVTNAGGPCENIIRDRTGLICSADDARSLCDAMQTLVRDTDRRITMGHEARQYAQKRSFENAFLQLWTLYQRPVAAPAKTGMTPPFHAFG